MLQNLLAGLTARMPIVSLGIAVLLGGSLAVTALPAPPAMAQETAPPCEGTLVVIRTSQLVEGGTMDGVRDAARDHEAWYRANGINTNRIVILPSLRLDRETATYRIEADAFVSLHVAPPDEATLPRGDAAWEAFVAKYRANSRIVEDATVCWPPGVTP